MKEYTPKRQSKTLTVLLCLSLCAIASYCFSTTLTMSTTASATVTEYNQDLGSCSCNRHSTICDNFCCCDSACSATQTSTWSSASLCRETSSSLETFCDDLENGGRYSFEDLACVYYSNRGNIGYFYEYPESGSISYPTSDKFAAKSEASQTIDIASSAATSNAYSSSQYLLKMNKDSSLKFFELWTPIAGGSCNIGFLNISESTSFTCDYPLSANTCPLSTKHLEGTSISLCQNGNCSTTQSFTPLTAASVSGTNCNNMITAQSIDMTLSSITGGEYVVDSITVTITAGTVAISGNQNYPVSTTITVNKPSASVAVSGNPGYRLGTPVTLLQSSGGAIYNLFEIADASGNCVTSGVTSTDILFGQNTVMSCVSANPCSSSLYIDTIPQQSTLSVKQWANDATNSSVTVGGTSSTLNTCTKQTITLNLLYSDAGWQLDQQSYIIGAAIESQDSVETSFDTKYLSINWIYVDPEEISTPPANLFYDYFEELWRPLREYFGVYSQ